MVDCSLNLLDIKRDMTFKKNIKTQIKEAQEVISSCMEAKLQLEHLIKDDYLFHGHNLIAQKWIKEYDKKIEYLKNFLEGAKNG